MRKRVLEFLVLLMVALGAGPVGAAIWNWSTTAGSNATADPSINWSEGMSPSSVNDSARAMMAVLAAWRNDISMANTTAGTSTAYTLATSEGVNTTPSAGQMVAFKAHATNGVAPTLTVDGGNTYPIWINGAAAGAGTIVAGTPYRVSFDNGNSAWLLEAAIGNPYNVALGGYLFTSVSSAPNSNFAAANGACISRTTYAAYFALVSTTYGACDGTTTFGVPDLRGRVPAMLDGGAGRLTNATNGCGTTFNTLGVACGNESLTLTLAQLPTGITSTNAAQNISVATAGNVVVPYLPAGVSILSTSVSSGAGNVIPRDAANDSWGGLTTMSGSNSISVTSSNTSGTAHRTVQPTYGVNVFVRIF